jgi:pimeloyl-ACP methyl ester carboxylesterase
MPTDFMTTPTALTGHVLERAGCPLHYWTGGPADAPLIALLHGATMDHRMWNAQVAALVDRYRLLVWDMRGQGQSQPMGQMLSMPVATADLAAILDAQGVDQAVLCGQSFGGITAQYMLKDQPGRVRALIVIDTTPISFPYPAAEVLALKATGPLFALWPWKSLIETTATSTALTPAAQDYARAAMQQLDAKTFRRVWTAVQGTVSRDGFPDWRIDVPLALIMGDQDQGGTIARDMPRWAADMPDVPFTVIPNAGHNSNQDNPDAVNAAILRFLAEMVPA